MIVKRAYADWSRYRDARHELMNAGLGLIEMPSAREGAKNRADIQMAVDAMELAYSREHVNTFVIVSGDSDFTPLVGKLRELNKRVIGVGNRESASELLIANCDEFIFYDILAAQAGGAVSTRRSQRQRRQPEPGRSCCRRRSPRSSARASSGRSRASSRTRCAASTRPSTRTSTATRPSRSSWRRPGGTGMVRLETDPRSGTYRVELGEGRATAIPPVPGRARRRPSARPRRATDAVAVAAADAGRSRATPRWSRPPVGGARARRGGVRGGRHPDPRRGPRHAAAPRRADLVRGHDHARPGGRRRPPRAARGRRGRPG